MKKDKNSVDEFFRDSLQEYKVTPSEAARSRFLDEAAPAGSAGNSKFLRWYNLLSVAVVITASVFLYFHFSQDNTPAPEKIEMQPLTEKPNAPTTENESSTPVKSVNANIDNQIPLTNIETAKENQEEKSIKNSDAKRTSLTENKRAESASGPKMLNATIESQVVPENKKIASESITNKPEQSVEQPVQALIIPEAKYDLETGTIDTVTDATDIPDLTQPADSPLPQPVPQPTKPPFGFTPYLLYSLDWNPKSDGNRLVHALGVEGKIHYGKFSLTSGIGVTSTKGNSNYEVQYNDYLGNYRKLDSITFAWDQKRYNLEPTYHMSDTKVWDTAVKLDSYQDEMRYNQLRIPVMLGYDFISRGRFVLGVKTGVEMVFYMKSRNLTEYEYSAGQNKLVSINSLTDELARNNFWFMANLSAACNISKRIVFEVEPRLQYLLNPDKTAANQSNQEVLPALRSSVKIKF